jgi:hypothetical protein
MSAYVEESANVRWRGGTDAHRGRSCLQLLLAGTHEEIGRRGGCATLTRVVHRALLEGRDGRRSEGGRRWVVLGFEVEGSGGGLNMLVYESWVEWADGPIEFVWDRLTTKIFFSKIVVNVFN